MKMRALAMFPRQRELRIVEVPTPVLAGERDALVRIREVGVCGTDREILDLRHGAPPPGSDRLILGHEALGEVVEVGPAVRTLEPGDLVAITVRRPCNERTCVACRMHRQDFCISGKFRECGIKEADGFMTELVVQDEHDLIRVPPPLAEVGVLIEPLAVAAKASEDLEAILRRYPWEPTGLRALVLGAGPIGLLGAMMLVARDVETFVYSLEPRDSDRARLVESFGAQYVSARDISLPELGARIGHADVIFEAVGSAKVAFGALEALGPNGVCVLSGVPGGDQLAELRLDAIMKKLVLENQVVFGTVNAARGAFAAAVRQLEQFVTLFPGAVRGLITARAPLARAAELIRGTGGIKQVVAMSA